MTNEDWDKLAGWLQDNETNTVNRVLDTLIGDDRVKATLVQWFQDNETNTVTRTVKGVEDLLK